jgi:hypothetical protein
VSSPRMLAQALDVLRYFADAAIILHPARKRQARHLQAGRRILLYPIRDR